MKKLKKINLINKGLNIFKTYLFSYKKSFLILLLIGSFHAILNSFIPYLTSKLFDRLIEIVKQKIFDFEFILSIFILWLLAKIFADFFNFIFNLKLEKFSTLLHADYLVNSFKNLTELPISFYKNKNQGEVLAKINRAASGVNNLSYNIIYLIIEFLTLIFVLFFIFFLNLELSLIIVLMLIIYLLIILRISPLLIDLQKKVSKYYSSVSGKIYDKIQNISEIKQNVKEKYELKDVKNKLFKFAIPAWLKTYKVMQKLFFSQRFLINLSQIFLFLVGFYFIKIEKLTIGELIAFNSYLSMVFSPFFYLGRGWQSIQNSLVDLILANKILNLKKEIYIPLNAISLKKIKGEIEFKNVFFNYEKSKTVLQNISFKIKPGEKVALVGKSGMGKSTIIDLILGFYFPQKGKIFIDNIDIKKLNLKEYRSKIAVVPQEPVLFNDTIKNNIKYSNPDATFEEIQKAAELAYATEFIEKLPKKYNQIVGWRGVKLSIGQKQRIALARAFLKNPDILILDEPTSSLDAESENYIKKSLEILMKDRTTIIIAHRLNTIKDCDRILVLENGQIVESGSHEELIKNENGVYFKLYNMQFKKS